MINLCRIGLIEDKLFYYQATSNGVIVANTQFKLGTKIIIATINVSEDVWDAAVEDYVFSNKYQRKSK